MSKIQLKKELNTFDSNQLIQLVLDLYSARKEVKEYLDFFLNPDVERLTEKFQKLLFKEINRGKYRNCKARISKIRQIIKDYASYGVGAEAEISLTLYVIKESLITERRFDFNKTLSDGIGKLLIQIIVLADKNLIADKTLKQIDVVLSAGYGTYYFTKFLRRYIKENLTIEIM